MSDPEPKADPDIARSVVESLLPDQSLREEFLEKLAQSIETAHRANPASWELTLPLSNAYIRLNVGKLLVFDARKNNVAGLTLRDHGRPEAKE